ncbi:MULTISPECIES: helix-turn-helix domain-containing protein [unclassified Micromonospora]|uniref:helix-turn-helix domain-containing protein n=1 Tax=unclassified Micromonospora TaxID=2617518 RepID=UPI00104B4B3E|nr:MULTISPECIES: helix-turn-helix domain-containing protein [unclassified Micromonospora]TDB69968.1 XRE family transcriptional regulator [Micromonospora sp. KC721]TDC42843.1 XRE family transcriptional regulator [Micromonospora sp. KC213]
MARSGTSSGSPSFSERLERLFAQRRNPRTNAPYTPDEVARATNLSAGYIRYLLSGARDNPTLATIRQLACFFQVDPNYFFGADEDDPDLETITWAARRLPPGLPRAALREIVEQVVRLEADRQQGTAEGSAK